MEQDHKTILVPAVSVQADDTTALVQHHAGHESGQKAWYKRRFFVLSLVLAAAVVVSCSVLGGYVISTRHHQRVLTAALREALNQGSLSTAHSILAHLRRHGFTSPTLTVLQRQSEEMQQQRDAWGQVQQYVTQGLYGEALRALARFTADTAYREKAQRLIGDIRTKELDAMIGSASRLYAGGQTGEAGVIARTVLDRDPSNQYARSMLALLRKAPARRAPRDFAAASKQKQAVAGDAAYKRGDFDAAVEQWSHTRAPAAARKIVLASNIRKYIRIGKTALGSGDYAGARQAFGKARVFAGLLGIGGSVDGQACTVYLSRSYALLGRQALAQGFYKQAALDFQSSLRYDPSNAEALKGIAVLNEEAERLYRTAYMMSGANIPEACRLYRRALDMSQPNDDVYKKIQEHIACCRP